MSNVDIGTWVDPECGHQPAAGGRAHPGMAKLVIKIDVEPAISDSESSKSCFIISRGVQSLSFMQP